MKEIEFYLENFTNSPLLFLGGFGLAFAITYFAIPSIVSVAQAKMLCDMPNVRASHTIPTPILGGIAVFAGLIISTIIFSVIDIVPILSGSTSSRVSQ